MSQTHTYDAAKHAFSFLGSLITAGFAKGSWLEASRNEDGFTFQPSSSGGGTRSRNNNTSGKVKLTLQAGSQANDILMALALADEKTGVGIGELFIKETNGTMKCSAENAWIMKIPDVKRGEESGEVEWVFECEDLQMFVGGLL
jgi:hypothetical protein